MNWFFFNGFHQKNTINTTDSTEEDMNMFMSDERKGKSEKMRTNLRSSVREKRVGMKSNFWKNAAAWVLAAGTLLGSAGVAKAFPSWMGIFGSYTTYSGGDKGTFTIAMNQDYSGLHAEVGINDGSWGTHSMSYIKNDSGNSIWQYTPSSAFPPGTTVEYYFHGWDDWNNGNIYAYNDPNASFTTAPTAPTISFSSIATNSLKITVNANGNGSATTYKFSYSTGTPGTPGTAATAGTAKSVTGLSPGTLYNFKARATAGGSTADVTGSQATRAMAPQITSVSYTAKSVTFTITNPNGNGDATAYYYYVGTSSSGTANTTCTPGTPVTVTVNPTTTYYIRARALAGGNATYADNYTFTTPADISEPTVTDSGASSVTATSATVGASVNAGGDSTTVSFGYSTTSGSYGTAGTVTGSPVTGTSATSVSTALSSLTPGATYYYRWSAYNSVNGSGSPVTATGSFTTLAAVPGAPTLASGSSSSITVAIATGSNVNTVQYAIKVVTGSTTKYVQADGSLGASAVWRTAAQWGATVTVTGLSAATTYTVSVAAKNSAGTATAYGTTANVTTASGVQKPTITEGTKTIGTTTATLPITVNMGGGASQSITLKYSTTSGSYTTSASVDPTSLAANVTAGTVTGTMPSSGSLSAGTVYYYQWTVQNSAGSTTKAGSFATEPTAGTVTLTGPTAISLVVTGKRSNGNAMLIVMKKGSAPSWTPSDGTKYDGVTGDKAITAGTSVGTSEYIVYNGTGGTAADGTAVTISGLDSGSQYYVKIYTYAYVASGTASGYNYNTTSPGSANAYTLSTEPTWSSPSLTATVASASQINLSWGAATGASGYVVVRKDGSSASTTKPSDGSSYSTGSGLGGTIVYVGSATSYNNTGLSADTTYSYTVWAYNGVSGTAATYNYLTTGSATATATTTASEPTQVSALAVTASSITTSGANFTWTKGNGTYTLVAGTAADSLTATPTDRTDYTASTTFSSGGQIATGVRTVYTNTASSVSGVTGLSANTLYTFAAYAFNGHSGTYNYNTASFPTVQFRTTANAPSAAPSISVSSKTDTTMTFSVTRATGAAGTVVVMYTAESMTGPSNPRTTYTASTTYKSGTRINNQGYVVYMGTDATKSLQVTGLSAGTTYYVRAYSFNGTSSSTATLCSVAYYTTAYGSANGTTFASQPTKAPTISITGRTTTSITLSITKGSDAGYTLVSAYTDNSHWTHPVDGTKYAANDTYSSGGALGSTKVVYSADGTSVTVTGLNPGGAYYFHAYSYNGDGTTVPANYYTNAFGSCSGRPMPNTPTLAATADGKTMVRLTATKSNSGTTTGMILVYGGSGTAPATGTVPAVGGTFAGGTVVGKWTSSPGTLEHVVAAGTTHNYRLYSYANTTYSAAASQSVSTGSFGADEIVDTFSYTNGVSLNGLNGEHGWSGAWSVPSGAAAPTVVTTNANDPKFQNFPNYPNHTGNRIEWALTGDGYSSSATRTFAAKTSGTLYVAAMISYQYNGAKKWCGIGFQSGGTKKMVAGRVWEDSDNAWLGIDNNNGTRTHSTTYEMKPYNGDTTQKHLVILKYDFSSKKATAVAFWNGSTVPLSESDVTWSVTNTAVNATSLDGIILEAGADNASEGTDAIGNVYFDEVRVATSWTKLLAREAVKPAAPTSFTVEGDGNEMVRGSFAAAESTILVVTNGTGTFTAPVDGTTYNVGDSAAGGKVVYKGGSESAWELVIPQGSTTYFAAYAYNGDKYSDATVSTPASIGTSGYDSDLAIDTISYTNNTTAGDAWNGGQGFSGAWSASGATVKALRTNAIENAIAIGKEITNYMPPAGNALQIIATGDGNKGSASRTLASAYGGANGKTMYVAFVMGYQYYGAKKWAGLNLLNGETEKAFFGKAWSPSYWMTLGVGAGSNTGWASKDLEPLDGDGGVGNHDNVYLVVGKVVWTGSTTANLYVRAWDAFSTTDILPEKEPTAWDAEFLGATGIGTITGVKFNAGADDTGSGTQEIGCAYFDSLRIGTNWDAIIGSVAPTGIGVTGTTTTNCYLGDKVQVEFWSEPVGLGQKASFAVSYDSGSTWTTPVNAGWTNNASGKSYWTNAPLQMTQVADGTTGKPEARTKAMVTGGGVTLDTTREPVASGNRMKPYIHVDALPKPTPGTLTGGQMQVVLNWTKATESGRTWDTLVVRYPSTTSTVTDPTPGKEYNHGDTIGEGTVVYRGDAATYTDADGLDYAEHTYKYYFYAENYRYYSSGATKNATTEAATETMPTINGNPNDWFGTPSAVYNSSVCDKNEFIWTDKPDDQRTDQTDHPNAGLKEFRVKADADYVYMLFKLKDITDVTKVHIGVGIDTRTNATSIALTSLGDDAGLSIGDGYFGENANVHYPERQLAIHYVNGTDKWQVEMFAADGTKWYAPITVPAGKDKAWDAAGSASTDCVEIKINRADLKLNELTGDTVRKARFTVATFLNTPNTWNNDGSGTREISGSSNHACDSASIMPAGVDKFDNDASHSAWTEDLSDDDIDFWMDIPFNKDRMSGNTKPTTPTGCLPADDTFDHASPTLRWNASSDSDGEVTGYFLEVATNASFGATGGGSENGSVLYRVNLPADTTSYKITTSGVDYWWRVRARDTSGELSGGTVQRYHVAGKLDNEGPKATLLYVGDRLNDYRNNTYDADLGAYYADHQNNYNLNTSVLDSQCGADHTFGFMIKWEDPNGVYATNKARRRVGTDIDGQKWYGHDDAAYPGTVTKAGISYTMSKEGDFAYNIVADQGRVSPNWDLIAVNTSAGESGPKPAALTIKDATGATVTKTWTWQTNNLEGMEYPGWTIEWGFDRPFQISETVADGNSAPAITNFVTSAFQLPKYDPDIEFFLTVSAEDVCLYDEYGNDRGWEPWPPTDCYGMDGDTPWTDASKFRSWSDNYTERLSSGFCADSPTKMRNVTTNQLIRIHVIDNDSTPPVFSNGKWGTQSVTPVDGAAAMNVNPGLVVTTNNAAAGAWAGMANKLDITKDGGTSQDILYQIYDGDLYHSPLSFYFNVYDKFDESGLQYGNTETTNRTKNGATYTMTNTSFVAAGWTTNWANFAEGKSAITRAENEEHHAMGSGTDTVLAWQWDSVDSSIVTALWGPVDQALADNPYGVTNFIQLDAWDADMNRTGDQAHALTAFGSVRLIDDDRTPPAITTFSPTGSGTNNVEFGRIARWSLANTGTTDYGDGVTERINESAVSVTAVTAGQGGSSTAFDGERNKQGRRLKSLVYDTYQASKYITFDVTGAEGAEWRSQSLTFETHASATGATNFTVTVQQIGQHTAAQAPDADLAGAETEKDGWSYADGAGWNASQKGHQLTGGTGSAYPALVSPTVNLAASGSRITFQAKTFNVVSGSTKALKVQYSANGTSWTDAQTITLTGGNDWASSTVALSGGAVGGNVQFRLLCESVNTAGVLVKNVEIFSGADGAETKVAEDTINLVYKENGDVDESDITVVLSLAKPAIGYDRETVRFKVYAWGATNSAGTTYFKDVTILGTVSSPRGTAITDKDLRLGNWTNSLTAADGNVTTPDKRKSGLWLTEFTATAGGDNIEESQHPKYEFLNAAGTAGITNGYYNILNEGLANGAESAALTMNTGPLGVLKETDFAVDTAYKLKATVADFDVDRTNDWRTASATQDFTLYDDDKQEPQPAWTYGGPLGVRMGEKVLASANAMGSGYDRTNHLSDHVIAENYGASGATEVRLHLGFFDYSGWKLTHFSFGGTTIWDGDAATGSGIFTAEKTQGVANSPAAEAVWKTTMGQLWTTYGPALGTSAATNVVQAGVTDLDADRADASGNNIDNMSVSTRKVGTLVLIDQDDKAPKWRTGNPKNYLFDIATNALTTGSGQSTSDSSVDLTNGTKRLTLATAGTMADPSSQVFKIYDSEMRGSNDGGVKLAITADITDPNGTSTGQHNTGLKRGGVATESASSVLSGDVNLSNTTLKLLAGSRVVTNAFLHYDTARSTSDASTKMSTKATRTVWSWNEISYLEAGDFLPSGVNSRALVASIEAYDADCDRSGDQMHATITGPTINVLDNDTVAPGNIAAGDITVNGETVGTISTEDDLPWTNNPVSIVRFKPVTDGSKATNDKEVTGIGGYRVMTVTDDTSLATVNGWTATVRAGNGRTQPVAAPDGVIGDPGFEDFGTDPASSAWTRSADTVVAEESSVTEGRYALKIPAGTSISQTIALGGSDWSGKTLSLALGFDAKKAGSASLAVTYKLDDATATSAASPTLTEAWATYAASALTLGTASNLVVTFTATGGDVYLDNLVSSISGLGSEDTVPMTFTATVQGATTNYLFAVDRDNNRPGDTLAGQAAAFYTAYDCTLPTSLGDESAWKSRTTTKLIAASEHEAVGDPTSEMYLNWSGANVTMSPDTNTTHKTGSKLYSPWKSYKIYRKMYTPGANVDQPNFDDAQVVTPVSTFDGFDPLERDERAAAAGWERVTVDDDTTEYASLANAGTKFITLKNLEPGENYIFAVVGLDKAGNESKYPVYALGDTIKFIVTQGVMRAWGTLQTELNKTELGGSGMFTPSNNAGLRATPALYWDARINQTTKRATRGYSLVYRDGYGFEEGAGLTTTDPEGRSVSGWGRIAGNSISNNFYAEPDGDAQKLGRGRMRFYRATYAGREFAEDGVVPLASEEVYALHNVKLSEGRNFVALHGVPYTNTFRGVFGCDTTYWPSASSKGDATRVEFYEDGRSAADKDADAIYWLGNDGKWYDASNNDVTDVKQADDFFTRGFAIVLPPASGFYSDATVTVHETDTESGFQTTNEVHVFDWTPILQMPTNDADHKFRFTVNCGTVEVKTIGRISVTNLVGVDNLAAFRAPIVLRPIDLVQKAGLPVQAYSNNMTVTGFVYNTAHPELGDRLLIWAPAVKDARIRGDNSDCGDNPHSINSMSQMYYDGTTWRWYAGAGTVGPEANDWIIRPNDAIIIRSFNGGKGNSWTWEYTPTNLYPAADRHFGH